VETIGRLFALLQNGLAPLIPNPHRQRRAAHVLWASLHGIVSLAVSGKLAVVAEENPDALAQDLVDTYLAGLRKESRSGGARRSR
jgi:hypothetical protein